MFSESLRTLRLEKEAAICLFICSKTKGKQMRHALMQSTMVKVMEETVKSSTVNTYIRLFGSLIVHYAYWLFHFDYHRLLSSLMQS